MGLFDRLFGRKEETKPQAQELTEELVDQRDQFKSRKHLVKKHLQKSLSNRIQLSRKRPLLK